jgi:hypothetical protein
MGDHDHEGTDVECPCYVSGWEAGFKAGEQSSRDDLLERYPEIRESEAELGEVDAIVLKAEYDPILGAVN